MNFYTVQRIIFIVSAIALLFCLALGSCQQADKDAINPQTLDKWEYFNQSNGLPDSFVWSIFEDSKGNIWAGTYNNGVVEYDGTHFTTYNVNNGLVDNTVLCIYEDLDGAMWFGTLGGISVLSNGKITNYTTVSGYPLQVFNILQDNNGLYWFATPTLGIIFYDGTNISQYYDNSCNDCNAINVFFLDNNLNVWVGTAGDLKIVAPDGSFKSYGIADGLPGSYITSIFQDASGNVWVGSLDGTMVARYRNNKFEKISLHNSMSVNWVSSITQLKTGELWFGTIGNGIINYDGIVMRTALKQPNGLPDNTVTSIIRDREGNIWVGSQSAGLARYRPR